MSSVLAVIPDIAQADVLDAISAVMEPWAGAKLKLLKSPLTPGRAVTLAECDADEADFVGYMELTVVWQLAARGPDGLVTLDTQAAQFLATATTTPNTIYGAYVTDSTEMSLLGVAELSEPVILGIDLLNAVDVQLRFNLTNNIGG